MKKKIDLAAIPPASPPTSANDEAPTPPPARSKAPAKIKASSASTGRVNRSISFTAEDDAYVNALAMKLGAERGKALTGSEVVRLVLASYRNKEAKS